MNKYDFGEKKEEYSAKDKKNLPVWQSPKYVYAKKKVIEMLESKEYKNVLNESDFWILMNSTKTGKMAYTGLIISHNGCLKINEVKALIKEKYPAHTLYNFYMKSEAGGISDLYESIWYRLNDLASRNNINKNKDNFER